MSSYHPSACLYTCKNKDYDNAKFEEWGSEAEHKKRKLDGSLYIDNLRDKVEYLFHISPDLEQPLATAKDRLYLKASIKYFEKLIEYIINFINTRDSKSDPSKNRYVMTYPSYWTPEQVAYLKSLAQAAGIVDKHDHPFRLIMYSEEASILRYLQEPHSPDRMKQGHKYLICDIGGSKVKMSLYEIKEPRNTRNNMKGEQLCDWDTNYMNEPPQLFVGAQSVIKRCEKYVLSRLSLPENMFSLEEEREEEKGRSASNGQADFGRLMEDITEILIKVSYM